MSTGLYYTLLVLGAVALWGVLVSLALWGWRNRGRRQLEAVGTPPTAPADLGEPIRGPHTGLYLGSTLAPSWQDRVAVGDLGDRADSLLSEYSDGLLIARKGASQIWIPRASIVAVRTERGLAGKAMTRDGVLVIRWELTTGTQIDSGLRADDKTVYPEWVEAFAEVTEKAYRAQERLDESESGTTRKKDER
ncbi:hypothetical protein [Gordonia shandongensis]|uniref:PH-like domain-containing protein n=1 Tax=Gordonia shandongensis TaxID=376351 RepID=UPI000424659B|nr:hypothetical protein [Gordonia shandongensis]